MDKRTVGKLIIGLSGSAGSGKTTVAKHIYTWLWTHGYTAYRWAFADAVKLVAATALDLPLNYFMDEESKKQRVEIGPNTSMLGRTFLQLVGTECFRNNIHPEFWCHRLLTRINAIDKGIFLIHDVRFLNEADAIRNSGGVLVGIHRPGLDSSDKHQSEQEWKDIITDYCLTNDGTLQMLKDKSIELINNIISSV